jgi:translation initiation factor 2B subunit (eIF-2B alpha/beta/delta family)
VRQVVLEVLLSAACQGKRFRVLVVDGRPELEGRQMMRRLLQVRDTYTPCGSESMSSFSSFSPV